MRLLSLVAAFAVAVPVVSHGQAMNARRSGQVAFGGNASSLNQQVGGYRVGPYTQQLRNETPVLNGVLTPDFAAIWRPELVQGSANSVFNSRFTAPNDRANGRRFDPFEVEEEEELSFQTPNLVAPIPQAVVFNQSSLVPAALNYGPPSQGSPEFLATDATIVNPEPSTYVLMVGGLVVMAVVARRRRAKA